jgi:predicted nucleotidyltransferase
LNLAGVKYLVIGGYAVVHYGPVRTTDDLDIWIAVSQENTRKVSQVLQTFGGFTAAEVKSSLFQTQRKVFVFGRGPVRIDILTSPDGINFKESYERRTHAVWDGVKVPLISLRDLIANKRASGRAKDQADVENLETGKKKPKRRKGS